MRTSYSRPSRFTIGAMLVIGILIPILIGSVLVFGLQSPAPVTQTQTSQNTTSTKLVSLNTSTIMTPGPCVGAMKYSGLDSADPAHNATLTFPIFAIPLNGTAEICITYSLSATMPNMNVTMNLTTGVTIGTFSTTLYPNGTVEHPFLPAKGIEISPNQTKITVGGPDPPSIEVAYTIRADSTKGFYFLNVGAIAPEACNDEFRLSVGYVFTQANDSGSYFPIPAGSSNCTPSGGEISSAIYAVKGVIVIPLECSDLTCDLNDTG